MEVALFFIIVFFGYAIAFCFNVRNARGVFLLYFAFGVVVPYIYFLNDGSLPTFLSPLIRDTETQNAASIIAIAFLTSIIGSVVTLRPIKYDVKSRYIRTSRLEALAIFAIFCFVIYVVLSIIFAGSIQNAILASYSRVRTNSSLANVRSVFFWGTAVFTTFAFYGMRFSSPPKKTRRIIYVAVICAGILSIADGGRAILVLFVLSLFMDKFLKAKSQQLAKYVISGVVLITGVSYVLLNWRFLAQGTSTATDNKMNFSDAFTGLAFVDHFQVSIQYAKVNGYDYGISYLNAALSFIPRDFFPAKAVPLAAQMRGYLYGDETGGIPPGLFGESYIFAGIFGVIIISFIFGRALLATSILCNNALRTDSPVLYAVAGIMVPLIGFTLVRGGLDIGVLRVGLPFFWCYVAVLLSTKRNNSGGSNIAASSSGLEKSP